MRTYSMVVIIRRVAGDSFKRHKGQTILGVPVREWVRETYVECERRSDGAAFTFIALDQGAVQAQNYLLPGNTVTIEYIPYGADDDEYQGEITGMIDITDAELERE